MFTGGFYSPQGFWIPVTIQNLSGSLILYCIKWSTVFFCVRIPHYIGILHTKPNNTLTCHIFSQYWTGKRSFALSIEKLGGLKACPHNKNNVQQMHIESNWLHPHGMHIELSQIESKLHQSTYLGGLNVNWKANWQEHMQSQLNRVHRNSNIYYELVAMELEDSGYVSAWKQYWMKIKILI